MIKLNRLTLLLLLPLITMQLQSCSDDKMQELPASKPDKSRKNLHKKPDGRTLVYNCGNDRIFTLKVDTTGAWIFLQDTTVYLESVMAASGAKFESDNYLYWSKGDAAMIEISDMAYQNCMIDRKEAVWQDARLRGIDFRAAGNEPGWYMEVDLVDSSKFLLDYGERKFNTPAPQPVENPDSAQTEYRIKTESHSITIEIFDESCTSMAGKRFPKRIKLTVDSNSYQGCGRWLGE